MEKKSTIKSTNLNTSGNQTCLNQSGLGMMFDQNKGQCVVGRVGKEIGHIIENKNSLSSNPITVYMNDVTLKTYLLDRAGKKSLKTFCVILIYFKYKYSNEAMVYTNISSFTLQSIYIILFQILL